MQHANACLSVQLSMLDGKKYAATHETGEDVASCELFLTPKASHPCLQHVQIALSTSCSF